MHAYFETFKRQEIWSAALRVFLVFFLEKKKKFVKRTPVPTSVRTLIDQIKAQFY